MLELDDGQSFRQRNKPELIPVKIIYFNSREREQNMVKTVDFKITLESALTTQPNKFTTPRTTLIPGM